MSRREQPLEPDLVSLRQLANLVPFSRTKLYELYHSGELPGAMKIGGRIMVNRWVLLEEWGGGVEEARPSKQLEREYRRRLDETGQRLRKLQIELGDIIQDLNRRTRH